MAQILRKVFQERVSDGKADGANTTRLLQRSNDIILVCRRRAIEIWKPSVLYDDRKGWPDIQGPQNGCSVSTVESKI